MKLMKKNQIIALFVKDLKRYNKEQMLQLSNIKESDISFNPWKFDFDVPTIMYEEEKDEIVFEVNDYESAKIPYNEFVKIIFTIKSIRIN